MALVQPSIPQTLIWDPAGSDARFAELLRLSAEAVTNRVDLLVWPEAALPPELLAIAVLMPITSPRGVTSGPPELPGFSAASVWMMPSISWPVPRAGLKTPAPAESRPVPYQGAALKKRSFSL